MIGGHKRYCNLMSVGAYCDCAPPRVEVTRESFLAAYVGANPHHVCSAAAFMWVALHDRFVLADEIDEDPTPRNAGSGGAADGSALSTWAAGEIA